MPAVLAAVIAAKLLAFFIPSAGAADSGDLQLRWVTNAENAVSVEVSGVAAATLKSLRDGNWSAQQWQRVFPVYADQGNVTADLSTPPMLGSYEIKASVIRFAPQFPLVPGVKYRAVFRPDQLPGASGGKTVSAAFQPVRVVNPTTVVSEIYPTAPVVPENLLKFYLHFSGPMSRGHIYDYIHLLDERGREVELPFLQIDEELWNHAMTRLTLFIDPGRIKRGVKPLEEIGPSLQAGKRFTLVIDREWEDADGNPLKQKFERKFQVGPPDREPMDMTKWKVRAPRGGTREPLEVTFPKPVDHALALRVVQVANAAGEHLGGSPELADAECRWVFTPATAWSRGKHQILVQDTFEDLAGNNVGKPFEVDLFDGVQRRITNSVMKLPFEVR